MKRVSLLLLVLLFLSPQPLNASSWLELRSPHFILMYKTPERKLASFLLRRAEELRKTSRENLPAHSLPITTIYLAPTQRDFRQAQPAGLPPAWSVGTAYPHQNLIILLSPRATKGPRTDIAKTLQHEYVHLVLETMTKGREIPRWLNEGFVMIQSKQWRIGFTYPLARAVLTHTLLPMADLHGAFPVAADRARLAYAQSFSFTSFIKESFGPDALGRLLNGIGHGLDVDTSLRLATGLDLRELERKWKRQLKKRYSWISVVSSFFSLWFLASLLFVIGYWRKKRKAKAIVQQWEQEESLTESPPASGPSDMVG